jgi:hypothetical protein
MGHLCDDMCIDIKVNNRKPHFDGPLKMAGKGAGVSPFFEKLIVEIDPFFKLGKLGSPPHPAKELSFI